MAPTINDDDDCLFPSELGEMEDSLLELDEMVGNKETAKQNDVKQELSQEDDTLSICGLEDSEITTDGEEKEEENDKKKVIFKRIWSNFGKKSQERLHSNLLHLMFTHAPIKLFIQGIGKNSVWDSK